MEHVVTYYTIHCPMCKSIQKMMDSKKIDYHVIDNRSEVIKKADEFNIADAPFAVIDGKCYEKEDLKIWIKEYVK